MNKKRLKIGLALGGGGARGLSHIGVIKVLEENNIPIDFIAGSSIGAMIGALYASSKDIKKVQDIALSNNWRGLLSLVDPSLKQGLINGDKVKKFIEKNLDTKHIEDFKVPMVVVATDLKTGNHEVIKKGNASSAVRASVSLPLVFKPHKLNGKLFADGGLSMPVPTDVVRNMGADIVIAVNLDADYFSNNHNNHDKDFGFYKIAQSSISILRYHLAGYNTESADIKVLPKVGHIRMEEFLKVKEVISEGEKAMKKNLKKLKDLI